LVVNYFSHALVIPNKPNSISYAPNYQCGRKQTEPKRRGEPNSTLNQYFEKWDEITKATWSSGSA